MTDNASDLATRAMEIARTMHRLLHGHPPEIQGAVLADLLATWLAGHPPVMREAVLQAHIEQMRPLIEINEDIMFGGQGHPAQYAGHKP